LIKVLTRSGTWANIATSNQIKPYRNISAICTTRKSIKKRNDMVEEKTSEVVVPLTHKSGEHKDEQNHFRAECRQSGISVLSAVTENTAL